jgi:hypothetical protein
MASPVCAWAIVDPGIVRHGVEQSARPHPLLDTGYPLGSHTGSGWSGLNRFGRAPGWRRRWASAP